MALTDKKYEKFYKTTGSDGDKISSKNLNIVEKTFEFSTSHGFHDIIDDPFLGPIVYMIQQMQDELDYLRTEISSNKDNRIVVGSNTVISFGDMVTVTDPKSGKVTGYNIVMTVVNGGTTKTTTLTLK